MIAVEERPGAVRVKVRAAPGASRERVVGVLGDALKIAVTGPPEKGKANERILAVLAKELGLPVRRLSLVSGSASRDKKVCVQGVTAAELLRRLAPHLS